MPFSIEVTVLYYFDTLRIPTAFQLYFLQNQIKPVILTFWTKIKQKIIPILCGYCS